MSPKKADEVRRKNKLLQNKESRIRNNIQGAVGLYGKERFDYKRVSDFSSTAEVNRYLKQVDQALDRNKYRYVNTGNENIPFLPRQVKKAFEKHQVNVNKSITSLNDKIKDISDRNIAESSGMKMSQYKRMQGRVLAGSKSGISGFGADFIKNSVSPKFLKEKIERQAKKRVDEVTFEKNKMKNYQKLYVKNLKQYFEQENGKIPRKARQLATKVAKLSVNQFATLFYKELIPNMDDWWESERNMRQVSESKLFNQVEYALGRNEKTIIDYDKELRHVPKTYERTQKDLLEALKETNDIVW